MSEMQKTFVVLYAPVIHRGYLDFFERHKDADGLYVIGQEFLEEFGLAGKEIRAIRPPEAKTIIENLKIFPSVAVLTKELIPDLKNAKLITAKEKISEELVRSYFPENEIIWDTAFLRWDEDSVRSPSNVRCTRVSTDPFDREMVARAANEAEKSSDWWRHVGAVIVKNGEVILESHNQHLPTEYSQYIDGDPRDWVEAGKFPELARTNHGERAVISEAARRGISLEGTSIYMNVFPCNPCANALVVAGVKKCFFRTGNAYLNVEEIFEANGVEIVKVE